MGTRPARSARRSGRRRLRHRRRDADPTDRIAADEPYYSQKHSCWLGSGVAHNVEQRVLEVVLGAATGRGLLRRGRRRCTASPWGVADVRLLNRMESVAEIMRAALEALVAAASDWLEHAPAEWEINWLGWYAERVDSRHGLPDGEDGFHLLTVICLSDAPDRLPRTHPLAQGRDLRVVGAFRACPDAVALSGQRNAPT